MAVKASLFDDKEKLDSSLPLRDHANSCHMSANPKRWRFQGFSGTSGNHTQDSVSSNVLRVS